MDTRDLARAPALITTPRLRLEAPRAEFAPAVVDSVNASRADLGFVAWGDEWRDRAWGERFVRSDIDGVARGQWLVYYVFTRAEGGYVGRVDLHSWDWGAPRCEVGYVGDSRHAGRGLMREAVLACVELAFSLGAARVQALSEVGNARALRFAEHALGFTREGVLRNYERDAAGRLGEQVMFAAYRRGAS